MTKILKFEAAWCNPCKAASIYLDVNEIEYTAVDIDVEKELAEKYGIMAIPTVVVLNDEEREVARFTGLPQIQHMGEYDND